MDDVSPAVHPPEVRLLQSVPAGGSLVTSQAAHPPAARPPADLLQPRGLWIAIEVVVAIIREGPSAWLVVIYEDHAGGGARVGRAVTEGARRTSFGERFSNRRGESAPGSSRVPPRTKASAVAVASHPAGCGPARGSGHGKPTVQRWRWTWTQACSAGGRTLTTTSRASVSRRPVTRDRWNDLEQHTDRLRPKPSLAPRLYRLFLDQPRHVSLPLLCPLALPDFG